MIFKDKETVQKIYESRFLDKGVNLNETAQKTIYRIRAIDEYGDWEVVTYEDLDKAKNMAKRLMADEEYGDVFIETVTEIKRSMRFEG